MQALGTWKGGFETQLEDDRAHAVTVDLPIDEGGRSVGPTALDLSLVSLAGCISTTFALVARKRRLEFQGMSVALEAERPAGAATFTRVHGTLRLRTRASLSDAETVLRLAVKICPVGVIFHRAGIPVEVRLLVAPTGPSPGTVAAAR